MKKFFKINITLIAAVFFASFVNYVSIIATDDEMVYILQQQAQRSSIALGTNFTISFVEDRKVVRFFQLGNLGDVLVTSNNNLCKSLSEKGLGGEDYVVFASLNAYCTTDFYGKESIFFVLPGNYTRFATEKLTKIASLFNAEIYFLTSNENIYEVVAKQIEQGKNVCGLLPLFQRISFNQKNLFKTQESVSYYACPVIGLNANGYKTLIKSANEEKNNQ